MPTKVKEPIVDLGELGYNVIAQINEQTNELILTVDLGDTGKLSSTGKMRLLGNTQGWKELPDTKYKLNLTLGVKV